MKYKILLGYFRALAVYLRLDLRVLIFCRPLYLSSLIYRSCPFFLFGEPLKLKNIMRVLNEQDFYEICHEI